MIMTWYQYLSQNPMHSIISRTIFLFNLIRLIFLEHKDGRWTTLVYKELLTNHFLQQQKIGSLQFVEGKGFVKNFDIDIHPGGSWPHVIPATFLICQHTHIYALTWERSIFFLLLSQDRSIKNIEKNMFYMFWKINIQWGFLFCKLKVEKATKAETLQVRCFPAFSVTLYQFRYLRGLGCFSN